MLTNLLLFAVAIVIGFATYIAMQPRAGTVMRTGLIAATPAAVFPHINDLHRWQAWSPWARLDPHAINTFEGPPEGIGSAFSWAGNKDVGEGKMTVVESRPPDLVRIRLDFRKPFANTSVATFTLKPEGAGTRVAWSMTGERPFIARLMCTLFNADKMVGTQFEKGLANLAEVVRDGGIAASV